MSTGEDTISIKIQIKDEGTVSLNQVQGRIKAATGDIKNQFTGAKNSLWEFVKDFMKGTGLLISTVALFSTLTFGIKGLVTQTIDFNREFTQVRTLLDESKTDVAGIEKSILDMSGALGNASAIARGTYQMISSGQAPADALKNIGEAAMFAQGGQVALKDAVSVGTVVLNTYGEAAGGLGHVYDVLWQTIKDGITTAPELAHAMGRVIPMAKEAGLSVEELSASLAVMTQISGNTNETVTALRGILAAVMAPTKEASDEAQRLGLNFSTAAIKAQGFSGWLQELFTKVKTGDGDMTKLFGSVEALNGIFQLGRNDLSNYTAEMQKMDSVQGNNQANFEKWKESFQGAWESMKNKLQAIFIETVLPLLKDVASWIGENSEKISNFVSGAVSGFKTVIGVISELKDVIIIAGKALILYFAVEKITPFFSVMKTGIGVVHEFGSAFTGLRNYGLGVTDSLKGAFRTATGELRTLTGAFAKLPTSIQIGIAFAGLELFENVVNMAAKGLKIPVKFDLDYADALPGHGPQKLAEMISGLDQFKTIAEKINEKINEGIQLTGKEIEFLSKYSDVAKETIAVLKDQAAAKEFLNKSLTTLKSTVESTLNPLGNLFSSLNHAASGYMGVSTATQEHIKVQKAAITLTEEQKKAIEAQRKAYDDLAASMGILTQQGYSEQSKKIKDLLSVYSQYKTQIYTNEDTLKKWVDKIDDLYKTALPGEKEALEKVRTEMVLGYGEANKSVVSIGEYEKQVSDSLNALFPFTAAINCSRAALYAQSLMIAGIATNNLPLLMRAWEMMGLEISGVTNAVQSNAEETKKWTFNFKDANEISQFAGNILGSVRTGLNNLGIKLSESTQGWFDFGAGAVSAVTGILSGNITGIIQGVTQAVSGLISALTGKSGELEAAERSLQGLTGTTEDWAVKVEELAKQLGGANSAGRAFNQLLADIISSSDVTAANFDSYIAKVREVVSTYEQGFATLEETQRNYGAAFSAILEKAVDLGLEGGQSMTGLIMLADEFGLKVKEIQEYLEQNKTTAIEGYRQYLEAAFSNIRIDVLDQWVAFEDKVKANRTLVDGVNGVSDSLIGLSNNIRLSQEQYDNFQLAANDAYNSLISQGFSANEALQVMQPMLERLAFLQQQYNYKVDDTTSALITQGIEAGLISADMKTENQLMLEGFDRIVQSLDRIAMGLGVKIPEALDMMVSNSAAAFSSMQTENDNYRRSLSATIDDIGRVGNSLVTLDDINRNVMSGNSIIPEWEDFRKVIGETDKDIAKIPYTLKALDTDFANLAPALETIFKGFQNQTAAWQTELEQVRQQMTTATKAEIPGLQEKYQSILDAMSADTTMFETYLRSVADKIGIDIPADITDLGEIYARVLQGMTTATDSYLVSAEGVVLTLDEIIRKQSVALAGQSGFGSSYGVYTEEEKIQKTSEFLAMLRQWSENRTTILGDEQFFSNFANKIKNFKGAITEEYLDQWNKWMGWIPKIKDYLGKGYSWNEDTKSWVAPTSAASGIRFVVPPGFDNEKSGYPLYVHSGELVNVFTREETQRILSDDLNTYGKVGTDTLSPFAISPQQSLYDFYTPPTDLYAFDRNNSQEEIELNDGTAPVFVPGSTGSGEKKIEINVNINFPPIQINVDVEGRNNTDDDELAEKITAKLKDNFRGFREDLVAQLKTEIKKELNI